MPTPQSPATLLKGMPHRWGKSGPPSRTPPGHPGKNLGDFTEMTRLGDLGHVLGPGKATLSRPGLRNRDSGTTTRWPSGHTLATCSSEQFCSAGRVCGAFFFFVPWVRCTLRLESVRIPRALSLCLVSADSGGTLERW